MSPASVPGVLYYDAEGDADWAVGEYLMGKPGEGGDNEWDPEAMVSRRLLRSWWSAVWDNGVSRWDGEENKNKNKTKREAKL